MLQSAFSLLPAVVGADGAPRRRRRGGRPQRPSEATDDSGKWIWLSGADKARNSYIYARKSFDLDAKPEKATVKATADSKYKLYVNGRYVGKGPVRSGCGYTYYDTHDVTDSLNEGKNVVAFLVHHFGENTYSYALGRPGLLCKAEIEAGGQKRVIASDDTWKVRRASDWTDLGARLSPRLGFQEVYDAGKRIENWEAVGFNDNEWENAAVVGEVPAKPWGDLEPRDIPLLHEERIPPRSIVGTFNSPERPADMSVGDVADKMAASSLTALNAGSITDADAIRSEKGVAYVRTPRGDKGVVLVLDFGREVFGNVELGIADSAGGCIDIGYTEALEDGRVKPNRGDVKYTDRVMLNRGRLEWQSFEPRAFRFVQLEFRRCPEPVALEYVRVNQTTYPVRHTGSFECGDALLNRIWETGAYTVQLCMEDTFIDCPWRERAQWWADARIQSRVAYHAFDDTKLLAQGLRQIASSQDASGAVSGMYPSGEDKPVPDFSLFWVFSLLDYYAFSDDAGLLRDVYPTVRRLLDWFAKYLDADGLLKDVPGWLFIDWADLDKRGNVTALNCLYYQALRVGGLLASIAEQQEDAQGFAERASSMRLAINKHLYSPKRALYADCRVQGKLVEKFSRQANVFAVLFDICDHYQRSTICRQLLEGSLPELETPYFASHFLEALYACDQHEAALDYIRKKWGAMIEAGATTLWEYFNAEGSLCHGWSACPTRDLIAEYVGIKPIPGSHRFAVAPHTTDLNWAKGSVNTRTGPLKVVWRATRNALTITIDVPEGVKVDVYPPGRPDSEISVDGKHWPSRFATVGVGSHVIRTTATRPPKPAPPDDSLKPTPVPHVEVLGTALSATRRRASSTSTRGRPTRKPRARTAGPKEVRPAAETAMKSAEPGAPEQEQAQPAEGNKTPAQGPKRPARRRGRRRTKSSAPPQEKTPEKTETQAPTPPAEEKPAEKTTGSRKRPRRRSSSRSGRRPSGGGPAGPEQTGGGEAPTGE